MASVLKAVAVPAGARSSVFHIIRIASPVHQGHNQVIRHMRQGTYSTLTFNIDCAEWRLMCARGLQGHHRAGSGVIRMHGPRCSFKRDVAIPERAGMAVAGLRAALGCEGSSAVDNPERP